MEEIVSAMITILISYKGKCSNEQLLKELRSYYEYIEQSEIERVLRDYSKYFKRIPEIKNSNGKVIFEEEIELIGG